MPKSSSAIVLIAAAVVAAANGRAISRRAALDCTLIRCLKTTQARPGPCMTPMPAGDPRAGYHAGAEALRNGRFNEAIEPLRAYLRLHPRDELAGYYLGTAYRGVGDERDAVAVWRGSGAARVFVALGLREGSVGNLRTAILAGDREPATYYKLGELLWDAGRLREASDAYMGGVALAPENDARTVLARCRVAEEAGDMEKALQLAESRVHRDASDSRGYLYAAEVCRRSNHLDQTISWLSRCANATGAMACYTQAADANLAKGNADAAAQWATSAARRFPARPEPRILLGLSEVALARFDLADRAYAEAATLDPNNFWIPIFRGDAAARSGRFAVAFRMYERAAALNPSSPAVHVAFGNWYRQTRNIPAAVAAYRRALKLAPDTPEATAALRELEPGAPQSSTQ
jgi:tetratricopeptide (TPR) repeat protein